MEYPNGLSQVSRQQYNHCKLAWIRRGRLNPFKKVAKSSRDRGDVVKAITNDLSHSVDSCFSEQVAESRERWIQC